MLRRTSLPLRQIRTSYYTKYGISREASDDEIKRAINRHTSEKLARSAMGMPGKKKLALMGFFASRDQFAKYILLRKRESYHIWLDERNMAKAITHAFALNKIKVEVKQSKTETKKYEGPTAEELNRQMAERQRKGQKYEHKQQEKQQTLNAGPETIDTETKDKKSVLKENAKAVASVLAPITLFLSWRNPVFQRLAIPVFMLPIACVLYILVEQNRPKSGTADLHAGEQSLSMRQRAYESEIKTDKN